MEDILMAIFKTKDNEEKIAIILQTVSISLII